MLNFLKTYNPWPFVAFIAVSCILYGGAITGDTLSRPLIVAGIVGLACCGVGVVETMKEKDKANRG